MYDVIIIGAGPVGLYTARLLEKRLRVLVIDSNKEIGKKACSGLYSTKLEDFVPIKKEWIDNKVRKAVLHSPSGNKLNLRKKNTAAYVVDREKFNKYLAKNIKSRILLGTRVKNIISKPDRMVVITDKASLESRMVIGCGGANSVVRKHFGVSPKEMINGLIAITQEDGSSDFVEMWFDKKIITDGFFWKIPRGKTTEYGAFGKNVNFKQLEDFFKLKKYEKRAAIIPTGPCRTYFDRALLIGDAAGITKPWSFGGVIYGFHCAKIASRVVFDAFEKNNFSGNFLKAYERGWKKTVGRSIRLGLIGRAVFKKMNNKQIDLLFGRFGKTGFLNKMDMDFPLLAVFG